MTDAEKERERFLTKIGQIASTPKAEPKASKKPIKKVEERPNGDFNQ